MARVVVVIVAATGLVTTAPIVAHAEATTECAAGIDTESLNNFIAREVGDLASFDTTRVIVLPDGRNVWTVQDSFISPKPGARTSSLRPPTGFAHNAVDPAGRKLLHHTAWAGDAGRGLQRERRFLCCE